MTRPLCIYHGNCSDGFTAAWAVWRALGPNVDFHPGIYGQPPPGVADRDVILVDFSYPSEVLTNMLRSGDTKQAMTILILDHHKTAAADLAEIEAPEFGEYDPDYWRTKWEQNCEWPVRAVFDMERSGVQIAWDYFYPDKPRPPLVDYVGDRDLWRFKLPHCREVNAFIFSHEHTFDNWNNLDTMLYNDLDLAVSFGAAIERKHTKDVREMVALTRRRMVIGGISVPVANLPPTYASDAAGLISQGERFAACYYDEPDRRVFSLRSTKDGADVSEIAKQYGGGGHEHAAGFRAALGWEGDISLK